MIYRGQALKMYFTTGVPHDNTLVVVLKYRKRNGEEGERDYDGVEDEDTGKYYVEWLNNELDELKTWTFWSYVTTVDGNSFPGNPFQYVIQPEGDYPVSKEFIKEFLGISDTSKDAKIDALIPLLVQQYEDIRNAPFHKTWSSTTGDQVNIYPEGMPVTIAYMFDFIDKVETNYDTVSSERIGSYSVSYGPKGVGGFYPDFITSQIKKYIRSM